MINSFLLLAISVVVIVYIRTRSTRSLRNLPNLAKGDIIFVRRAQCFGTRLSIFSFATDVGNCLSNVCVLTTQCHVRHLTFKQLTKPCSNIMTVKYSNAHLDNIVSQALLCYQSSRLLFSTLGTSVINATNAARAFTVELFGMLPLTYGQRYQSESFTSCY